MINLVVGDWSCDGHGKMDSITIESNLEDSLGFWQQIGEFGGMPVTLSVSFAKIDGRRIAFYSSESIVVHWDMIREWVKKQAPNVQNTNAMNFHHAISYVQNLNKKAVNT